MQSGSPMKRSFFLCFIFALLLLALFAGYQSAISEDRRHLSRIDQEIERHAAWAIDEGRLIFRSDTFGDEAFWGDSLKLHQAIKGAKLGGVGPGVSPNTALAVGL